MRIDSVSETSVEETGDGVDVPGDQGDASGEADGTGALPGVPSFAAYRATVDAAYRAYAIDQGCTRVREIEESVISPAMHRIESEDPARHLVGLDYRLKGEDRLTEKVTEAMRFKGLSADAAFAEVKDAIRYTFQYPDDRYASGTLADCRRLEEAGFERYDRKNTWDTEHYRGINTRWRDPGSGQMFEVQFHTEASFKAKQETHQAYERLRASEATDSERDELQAYQRRVATSIPVPPGAAEIEGYRSEKQHG